MSDGVPNAGWAILGLAGIITAARLWLDRKRGSGLPAEGFAASEPQTTCDPTPKRGMLAFQDWTIARYGGGDLGIARACDQGGASEHKEGRAWDWDIGKPPVPAATVETFLAELLANDAELARRMGVLYLIYNRRIWSAPRHAEGWRAYGGPDPHTGHVHVSLSRRGAAGETSFYKA